MYVKKYDVRSEKSRICIESKLIGKDDLTNILHSTCFTSVLVFTFRIFKILLINDVIECIKAIYIEILFNQIDLSYESEQHQ